MCLCVNLSSSTYCTHPQSRQTIRKIIRMAHSGSANTNPLGRKGVLDIHEVRCSSLTEQLPLSYLLLYLHQYNYPHWHSSLVQGAFKRKWTAGFTKPCGSEAALRSRVCVWRRTWQHAHPQRMHANTVLGVSEIDLWLAMAIVSHTNH